MMWAQYGRILWVFFLLQFCQVDLSQKFAEEDFAGKRKGLILVANQVVAEKGTNHTQFQVWFNLEEITKDVTVEAKFVLSNPQVLNIGQTGLGFALNTGTTEVYAEYQGLRSNIIPFTVIHQAALHVVETKSLDMDQNGFLDSLYLRFNKSIKDNTLNLSAWQAKVLNANNFSISLSQIFYPAQDSVDDEVLHVSFLENEFVKTGARLVVHFQAGALLDQFGNSLGVPEAVIQDRAAPVLVWAKVSEGTKQVLLNFSEVVFPENLQCEAHEFFPLSNPGGISFLKNGGVVGIEEISLYCRGSLLLVKLSETIAQSDNLQVILNHIGLVDEAGNFALSVTKNVEIIPQGGYFIRPHLTGNAQHGAHSFLISHGIHAGKYLVVHGNASRKTSLYDPFTGSFCEGPELTFLSYIGSHSFIVREGERRYDLVTVLGSGNRTNFFNMATGTFTEGPKLTDVAFTGASSSYIKSGVHKGKEFVVLGFKTNKTNFFNPYSLSFSPGPNLAGNAGLGSLILSLSNGDLLILHGENTNGASLYNAQAGLISSFSLPVNVHVGAQVIKLEAGSRALNYLVYAGGSLSTFFVNPTTSVLEAGPSLDLPLLPGSAVAKLSPTKHLVLLGSGKNTREYEVSTNAFSTGPDTKVSLGIGAHAIALKYGKHAEKNLVIAGGNSTASDYLEDGLPSPQFTTGPALVAHAYLGSHSIAINSGIHQGKFLVVHGAGTATSIFDPNTEEFLAGPSLPEPAYDGAHSIYIPVGPHAGKILIILGNNTNKSALYDPTNNTISLGPNLTGPVGEGGSSIVLPSGPYANCIFTIHGGGANTSSLYNPITHEFLAGPTFTSVGNPIPFYGGTHIYLVEGGALNGKIAIVIGGTNAVLFLDPNTTNVSAILYQTGTAYHGAHTVKIEWGIYQGKYLSIHGAGNGINLFDPSVPEFRRIQNTEGESQFLTDLAYIGAHTVKIPSGVNAGKYLLVHAFYSKKTSLFDPMTGNINVGPELAMPAGDGAHSIVYAGTKILTIHGSGNGTSKYQDSSGSYFAGPNLSFTSFEGSHSIQIPSSANFLLIHGAGTSTSIFNANLGSYELGKPLPTNAFSGSHSVTLTHGVHSGKIMVFHGVNSNKVSIFDPSTGNFSQGPVLPQNLLPGAHSIRLSNGNILVLQGYNQKTTFLYNASTNTFVAGPDLTDKIYPGSHAISVESGPHSGKFLIWHCASLSSSLYDEGTNSFAIGVNLPYSCSEGAHSMKIPSGSHANKYLIFLSGGRNTAIYDPATHTTSIGPILIYPIYAGSHSFLIANGVHSGKILNIAGNGLEYTNLYDPITHSFSAGPRLEGKAYAGAHSFSVTTGPYGGKTITILGGGNPGINVYIP